MWLSIISLDYYCLEHYQNWTTSRNKSDDTWIKVMQDPLQIAVFLLVTQGLSV